MHDTSTGLEDIVRKYRICWDTWPLHGFVEGGSRVVGFQIDLLGTHAPSHPAYAPGCATCLEVYEALRCVANAVLPPRDRDSTYELSGFDSAIHYAERRHGRPDVKVTITIQHKTNINAPLDACEARCYGDIVHALARLGAHEGAWPRERPSGAPPVPTAAPLESLRQS
ncbi:MAG: hypothetical protein U0166_00890 [Acidobacteriota bacterium]